MKSCPLLNLQPQKFTYLSLWWKNTRAAPLLQNHGFQAFDETLCLGEDRNFDFTLISRLQQSGGISML
jgi:hypothetical protein